MRCVCYSGLYCFLAELHFVVLVPILCEMTVKLNLIKSKNKEALLDNSTKNNQVKTTGYPIIY